MCGIAGFFGAVSEDEGHRLLQHMQQSLRHRGPDSSGKFLQAIGNAYLGLAQTLLAVIGAPGEGQQPFEVPDGVLIFNGAIYNFKELRRELEAEGLAFSTRTDTEVLAQGLRLRGIAFLEKARGMFSFAYWNAKEQCLLLGRDPLGTKPLYYSWDGNRLFFGSEYKAFLPFVNDRGSNRAAILDYLRLRYIPGTATAFQQIQKVPCGTVLIFDCAKRQISEKKFFSLDAVPLHSRCDSRRIYSAIEVAMQRRAVADVSVGALLSGGIDSATVCDLLSRSINSLQTYTLGIGAGARDETAAASGIAGRLGVPNLVIPPISPSLEDLRNLAFHLEDPYGDPIILALDRIFSFIGSKHRVIVTGEGSDELFSGYIHHRAAYFISLLPWFSLQAVRGIDSRSLATMINFLLPYAGKIQASDSEKALQRFRVFLSSRSLYAFQHLFFLFSDDDLVDGATGLHTRDMAFDGLPAVRRWDMENWLPHSQLFKLDRIAMRSSIEAREPFVDQDLWQSVAACAPGKHVSWRGDKVLLRKTLQGRLRIGEEIVTSRKTSFFQPLNQGTAPALMTQMKSYVQDQQPFLREFVRENVLTEVLGADAGESAGLLPSKQLFSLCMLALSQERLAHG